MAKKTKKKKKTPTSLPSYDKNGWSDRILFLKNLLLSMTSNFSCNNQTSTDRCLTLRQLELHSYQFSAYLDTCYPQRGTCYHQRSC